MHDYGTPIEGEYIPPRPAPPPAKGRWKNAGAAAVGLGVIAAKFKGLLFLLLNLKWLAIGFKVLASAGTFLISLWLYTQIFGFAFALVFLIQIFIHEMGHVAFMRFYGVPATMPFFIPGFGALIRMRGAPANALQEAYIGLGGPLAGTAAATACMLYGMAGVGQPFWIAAAYAGFFINLFNMIPVVPLDGGRVAAAISPRIWVFGLVLLVVLAFAFHLNLWNPLLLIIVLLSLPRVVAAWRGQIDPHYYALTQPQRIGIMVAYFSLTGYLVAATMMTHARP